VFTMIGATTRATDTAGARSQDFFGMSNGSPWTVDSAHDDIATAAEYLASGWRVHQRPPLSDQRGWHKTRARCGCSWLAGRRAPAQPVTTGYARKQTCPLCHPDAEPSSVAKLALN